MSYLDIAKDQVLGVVKKVVDAQPPRATAQTVTIACSPERVAQFWGDPLQISVVLGDIAEVETSGDDRYTWRLLEGPAAVWNSRVVRENDGVRFVGGGNELAVRYRPAPNGLGTEVTLRATTPAPGLLSGAAAFMVLYRLRALLQTGEVPTIRCNPSARASAR
ncbi:hypothetical protein [Mycobacterium sp. Marseille-P9652]|uniref:hypothetical protein n=1 Tax=Mycobacterium sp. Marseille-P9652 TaxID=2654950 RepID=UPI0012E88332|nr:hypothetical protein [Mycobacterium sp. Marseille-P9652]